MWFFSKISQRRSQVRKDLTTQRFYHLYTWADIDIILSVLLGLVFTVICTMILAFDSIEQKDYYQIIPKAAIAVLICGACILYISRYQKRIVKNHPRLLGLAGIFTTLLIFAKIGAMLTNQPYWGTGTAIAAAIILAISYNQRFATGMSIFYVVFACFVFEPPLDMKLFFTVSAGVLACCFSLNEIRTRTKLLEVGAVAAVAVFIMSITLDFVTKEQHLNKIFVNAGWHAFATMAVAILLQSLLPLLEKTFKITTSMTLLDYSDANQPLLKRLAMEAPGTFSHSLMIGSIAEAAAEAIGRNGLLCRVGAYYHDIGKINKPGYFMENQVGSHSQHRELSPAMSQLIIVGHVKDGMEFADEYGLPAVLKQFIETHHGTTLVEYFYNQAKKKLDEKPFELSETEFRYAGPKPLTKEAAIVMLADSVEGTVRALPEVTPTRIEVIVHNMAMKRLQDGQFDECDLSLRELSLIEASISKTLIAHYHGRIAYPKPMDVLEIPSSHTDIQAYPNE